MFSKHLDVPRSSRHDTFSGGLYRFLLCPLLLARLFYKAHPPFLCNHEGVSILPIFSYSPFVGLEFICPLSLLPTLLQRGNREGLSLLRCPVSRHHGLVIERVHLLCW